MDSTKLVETTEIRREVLMKVLYRTESNSALLFVRLALGIVMFPHGAQKALGWFGGGGLSATVEMFAQGGMPAPMVWLLIAIEFLGSIFLIAGFMTRIAAFGIGGAMAICAMANHVQNGFFMNWFGQQQGEGFEFHILVVGMALALVIKGGGLLSVDRFLGRREK
jgi:putative oxidoreductase